MKKYKKILLSLILILIVAYVYENLSSLGGNPFSNSLKLIYPSYVTADDYGYMYIVDNSMRRVVVVDEDGLYISSIEYSPRRKNELNNPQFICADEKYMYISDAVFSTDGNKIESERILKYTRDGKLEGIIFQHEYSEENKPFSKDIRLQGLEIYEDTLYFVLKENDGFTLISINEVSKENNSIETVYSKAYEELALMTMYYAINPKKEEVYFTTKKGEIVGVNEKSEVLVYTGEKSYTDDTYRIAWDLDVDEGGNIFFSDIGSRELYKINTNGNIEKITNNCEGKKVESNPIFYRININNGNIYYTDGENVIVKNGDFEEIINISKVNYSIDHIVNVAITNIFLFILLMLCLYKLVKLLSKLNIKKVSNVGKISLIVIGVLFISTFLVTKQVFDNMGERYENTVLKNMSNMASIISNTINLEGLKSIDEVNDYMNEEYREIRNLINTIFNKSSVDEESYYCVIYKVDNGLVYSSFYNADSIGAIYPQNVIYEGSEYEEVYSKKETLYFKDIKDAQGNWFYVLSPIIDEDGEVIAAIEVGTDMYAFEEGNKTLFRSIVLNVITISVIIVLAITELLMFNEFIKQYREKNLKISKECRDGRWVSIDVIRPIVFLIFLSDCIATSFLPLYAKSLYEPFLGIPEGVLIAVPISAELFFTAVFSVLCGFIIERVNFRRLFICGFTTFSLGLFLCSASQNILMFTVSKSIVGIGMGVLLVTVNTIIASRESEEEQNRGFSSFNAASLAGFNCSTILGANLATQIGHGSVYMVAAMISIIALILVLIFIKEYSFKMVYMKVGREKTEKKLGLFRFILNGKVIRFFLLIMIPYAICGNFLTYLFPLFATEKGMSEASIGQALLVNGLFVIYLGPVLTKYISNKFGTYHSVVFASVAYIIVFLFFGFNPTIFVAIVVLGVIGIADSFGVSAQAVYYSNLDVSREYGSGRAMGVYSMFENIAQTIGPFIFGVALMNDYSSGIIVIAITMAMLLGISFLIEILSKVNKTIRHSERI